MPSFRALFPLFLAAIAAAGHDALLFAQDDALAAPDEAATPADPGAPTDVEPAQAAEPSPFLKEPETPEELFHATILSVRLARPRLARQYLEKFTAANPDDATLVRLREQYGPNAFLRLTDVEELKPLANDLLDRVNAAFQRSAADPATIDGLLEDLSAGPAKREYALEQLRVAGAVAVPRIIQHIANGETQFPISSLQGVLIRIGNRAVPALIAALDSPETAVRIAAIDTLSRLANPDLAIHLYHPAFAPEQPEGVQAAAAEGLRRLEPADPRGLMASREGVGDKLEEVARRYYRGDVPIERSSEDGFVELWVWDPQQRTVLQQRVTPKAASTYRGLRFARQALDFAPSDPDVQSLFLALALAASAQQAAANDPLPIGAGSAYNLALAAGPDSLKRVLTVALEARDSAVAQGALEILGQTATPDDLLGVPGEPSPIVAALDSPMPGARFQAAAAILQIGPPDGFLGAPRVVEVLARTLHDRGGRRAIVVHKNDQVVTSMADAARQLGYEPLVAKTGREAFKIAAERNDVELIILDLNVVEWELHQTLANLRADARTVAIPIAIAGAGYPQFSDVLTEFEGTAAISDAQSPEAMRMELDEFLKELGPPLTPQQRAARIADSAYWLARIADSQTGTFDLIPAEEALIEAASNEEAASNAVRALAAVSTETAQQFLQELALAPATEPELRVAAAQVLARHIGQYGVLLRDRHIAALKQAWRDADDNEFATALAAVIGALSPDEVLVGERLQRFADEPLPAPFTAE